MCALLTEGCSGCHCCAGGASLHLCMTPHGPDTTTFESAVSQDPQQPVHLGRSTLAFMFETSLTPRVTPAALGSPCIDRDYYKCWVGLKSHFDRNWGAANNQQQQQQQKQQERLAGSKDGALLNAAAVAAAAQ